MQMKTLMFLAAAAAQTTGTTTVAVPAAAAAPATATAQQSLKDFCLGTGRSTCMTDAKTGVIFKCPLIASSTTKGKVYIGTPVAAVCSMGTVFNPISLACSAAQSGATGKEIAENCLEAISDNLIGDMIGKAFPNIPSTSLGGKMVSTIGSFVADEIWDCLSKATCGVSAKDWQKLFSCTLPGAAFSWGVTKAIAVVVGAVTNPLILAAEAAGGAIAASQFKLLIGCGHKGYTADKDLQKTEYLDSVYTICGDLQSGDTLAAAMADAAKGKFATSVAEKVGILTNNTALAKGANAAVGSLQG